MNTVSIKVIQERINKVKDDILGCESQIVDYTKKLIVYENIAQQLRVDLSDLRAGYKTLTRYK